MDADLPHDFVTVMKSQPADPRLTRAFPRHGTTGEEWLEVLPTIVTRSLRRWDLTLEQPAKVSTGGTAIIYDVLRQDGTPAALKVSWPFFENAFEHLALREWAGHGMVRLEAAEPRDYSLVLERLDSSRTLSTQSILDACEVIGTLIRTLDRPASAKFESLIERSERWEAEFASDNPRVPRRLVHQARSHMTALIQDLESGAVDGNRLVHTDLHDTHVLAPLDSARDDWLAISPWAAAGEPAFGVAPMMWNRPEETDRAHNRRAHIRMRAGIISDAAGLDEERVRAWTFVRLVRNAVSAGADGNDNVLTRSIFLAKMFDQ